MEKVIHVQNVTFTLHRNLQSKKEVSLSNLIMPIHSSWLMKQCSFRIRVQKRSKLSHFGFYKHQKRVIFGARQNNLNTICALHVAQKIFDNLLDKILKDDGCPSSMISKSFLHRNAEIFRTKVFNTNVIISHCKERSEEKLLWQFQNK